MKSMIAILLLIFTTCGALFYLYSEDGQVKKWEKAEDAAYQKALKAAKDKKVLEATKQ